MSGLLSEIYSHIKLKRNIPEECFVNECESEGCAIAMDWQRKDFLLLDIDCYQKSKKICRGKRCDFCFIGVNSLKSLVFLAPIEIKQGRPRISHVVEQLKSFTQRLEQMFPARSQYGRALQIRFRPIVVSGQGLHRRDGAKLKHRNNQVKFRGRSYSVLRARCGDRLSRLVS